VPTEDPVDKLVILDGAITILVHGPKHRLDVGITHVCDRLQDRFYFAERDGAVPIGVVLRKEVFHLIPLLLGHGNAEGRAGRKQDKGHSG